MRRIIISIVIEFCRSTYIHLYKYIFTQTSFMKNPPPLIFLLNVRKRWYVALATGVKPDNTDIANWAGSTEYIHVTSVATTHCMSIVFVDYITTTYASVSNATLPRNPVPINKACSSGLCFVFNGFFNCQTERHIKMEAFQIAL